MWIIRNINDAALFWNNDSGWGDRSSADRFDDQHVNLPLDGEWVGADTAQPVDAPAMVRASAVRRPDGRVAVSIPPVRVSNPNFPSEELARFSASAKRDEHR